MTFLILIVKCVCHVFVYYSVSITLSIFLTGIKCPALSDPKNGSVFIILNGKAAVFTCNSGFTIIGSSYLQCNNGKWSFPPPKCQDA